MAPSTSAATSDDEFQDATDGDGDRGPSVLPYASQASSAPAGASSDVQDSTPGKINGSPLDEAEETGATDTLRGGAGPRHVEATSPALSPATGVTKSQLKKMKKKKSKAALRLAASRDPSPSPSPSPSPAESPAPNSPIPGPAASHQPRRVPSPPPLLAPGARIGEAFANAQPFGSLASHSISKEEDQEGPNGEPLSPRDTSSFPPLPPLATSTSSSPSSPSTDTITAEQAEEIDTITSLPSSPTVPTPTTSSSLNSRPFSLVSNPDSPVTSSTSSKISTKGWHHQSLASHSHADPNQTTGGGQTSPSLTGMARRSELSSVRGNGNGGSRGGALEGKDLGKKELEGSTRVSLLELDSIGGGGGGEEEAEMEGEEVTEADFQEESLSPRHSLSTSPSPTSEDDADEPGTPTRFNHRRNGHHKHKRGISEASSLGTGSGGAEGKYGFFRQRVEQQNTILESDPSLKRASVQGSWEIRENFARVRQMEEAKSGGAEREKKKDQAEGGGGEDIDWDFWGRVMSNYEEVASTNPRELSRAIQRGIPPALRGMTWQLMAATKDPLLVETYSALLKQTSPHEKSIGRDLNRTFPKHSYFKDSDGVGQQNLFNVVKAYSLYDEEVGYTQGLQFIVGPLLLNMPDEEAFCVLVRLMKSYDLRSHYTPNMPGLQLRLFQFDRLLEELLPGVFMHLLRQGIKSSMYASQWFLTLFGYRFPLELVSSVFDLVFAEGVEAIFRFSVAILKRSEDKIVQLEFEDLIEFLKNELFEVYAPDPDDPSPDPQYKAQEFVREALQVKITPLMLDQFGEEWTSLCAQQSAHTLELDSLRKANAQLSSQVRQLEASLSQVNEEHCELVKQVVMAKLEREELEDELVKYKIAYADLSHQQASDGASFSRASMQAAQEREDRLSRGSAASFWSSAMSRSSGSTGV